MEYTERALRDLLGAVVGADGEAMEVARKRQAELAKPPGSLGTLEDLSVKLAGITGKVRNSLENKVLLVFAADNGVVEEGVSSAPQSVTAAQTVNLTRGVTGASSIAARLGCRVVVCDVGVNADLSACPAVLSRKIAYGTMNIAKGPAMTREEAVRAILTGAALARDAVKQGADVIGIGEMGIGNTTTSSAVLAVLSGAPVKNVTGRGGGKGSRGDRRIYLGRRSALCSPSLSRRRGFHDPVPRLRGDRLPDRHERARTEAAVRSRNAARRGKRVPDRHADPRRRVRRHERYGDV